MLETISAFCRFFQTLTLRVINISQRGVNHKFSQSGVLKTGACLEGD